MGGICSSAHGNSAGTPGKTIEESFITLDDFNDDEKQYEEYEDDDYEAMSITTTTTATSTSYLAEMDGSPVNSNFEVNEVSIATNVIEVS